MPATDEYLARAAEDDYHARGFECDRCGAVYTEDDDEDLCPPCREREDDDDEA